MKQQVLIWLTGPAGWWVFSCLVRSLPEPVPMGSRFYLWMYRFVNLLAANKDLVDKTR